MLFPREVLHAQVTILLKFFICDSKETIQYLIDNTSLSCKHSYGICSVSQVLLDCSLHQSVNSSIIRKKKRKKKKEKKKHFHCLLLCWGAPNRSLTRNKRESAGILQHHVKQRTDSWFCIVSPEILKQLPHASLTCPSSPHKGKKHHSTLESEAQTCFCFTNRAVQNCGLLG